MKKDNESNIYVGRAGTKLEQANSKFGIRFEGKLVLDIGSSTGGFSDYVLRNKAKKVIAVELGTNQMDRTLSSDSRIELHEKTDILDVSSYGSKKGLSLSFVPQIVLIDLSFVTLKNILPHVFKLVDPGTQLVVLVKPQFEAKSADKNRGIIKNENIRRRILKDFEAWVKDYGVILDKTDSIISGTKGNKERFYLITKSPSS